MDNIKTKYQCFCKNQNNRKEFSRRTQQFCHEKQCPNPKKEMIETVRKVSNNAHESKKSSKQIIHLNNLKHQQKVCKKNIGTSFACSFCNKIFLHESKSEKTKKLIVIFSCKICSKSYYCEDHFRKHEQKCQNIDFSFSIYKCDDFIPSFIGKNCFYSNRNGIVSNDPLDNSEDITSLLENKK